MALLEEVRQAFLQAAVKDATCCHAKPNQDKLFWLYNVLAVVFYHSNRRGEGGTVHISKDLTLNILEKSKFLQVHD